MCHNSDFIPFPMLLHFLDLLCLFPATFLLITLHHGSNLLFLPPLSNCTATVSYDSTVFIPVVCTQSNLLHTPFSSKLPVMLIVPLFYKPSTSTPLIYTLGYWYHQYSVYCNLPPLTSHFHEVPTDVPAMSILFTVHIPWHSH